MRQRMVRHMQDGALPDLMRGRDPWCTLEQYHGIIGRAPGDSAARDPDGLLSVVRERGV